MRWLAVAVVFLLVPVAASAPSEKAVERVYDANGRLLWERGHEDGLDYQKFYRHAKPDNPGKGGNGGNGGNGGSGDDPGTDCESDKFRETGYAWTVAYAAVASSHVAQFQAAGDVWGNATGSALFAGVTFDARAAPGTRDGVNAFGFADLGASSTIAVTTTWYNRFTGEAVESDAQYNAHYAWSTDGSAGSMDVLNIAVHEIGHTLGLDHPKGKGIDCLTMHAYASAGETQKRTLGDGDILGIRALYGP